MVLSNIATYIARLLPCSIRASISHSSSVTTQTRKAHYERGNVSVSFHWHSKKVDSFFIPWPMNPLKTMITGAPSPASVPLVSPACLSKLICAEVISPEGCHIASVASRSETTLHFCSGYYLHNFCFNHFKCCSQVYTEDILKRVAKAIRACLSYCLSNSLPALL